MPGCLNCGKYRERHHSLCRACEIVANDELYEDFGQHVARPPLQHDWAATCINCGEEELFRCTDKEAYRGGPRRCPRCGGKQLVDRADFGTHGNSGRARSVGYLPVTFRERLQA